MVHELLDASDAVTRIIWDLDETTDSVLCQSFGSHESMMSNDPVISHQVHTEMLSAVN